MNKSDRKKLQRGLYIGLAIALILCLFPMPYGFYQFVRFAAMAIFAYLAYCENKNGHVDRIILFIVLAILFQPFAKIALGRDLWNIVDIIVAGYLIYLFVKERR
ncbi:MAG: hypothetical protein II824_03805 [Bacteroidales bacterium]|nr:hypothetical protein [Bacteroidales bacterium]